MSPYRENLTPAVRRPSSTVPLLLSATTAIASLTFFDVGAWAPPEPGRGLGMLCGMAFFAISLYFAREYGSVLERGTAMDVQHSEAIPVDEAVPVLIWNKQSYKRYTAQLGPVQLEVRRVGIRDHWWVVGEVFGVAHHCYDRDERPTLEEAQISAETVARAYIEQLRELALGELGRNTRP